MPGKQCPEYDMLGELCPSDHQELRLCTALLKLQLPALGWFWTGVAWPIQEAAARYNNSGCLPKHISTRTWDYWLQIHKGIGKLGLCEHLIGTDGPGPKRVLHWQPRR